MLSQSLDHKLVVKGMLDQMDHMLVVHKLSQLLDHS